MSKVVIVMRLLSAEARVPPYVLRSGAQTEQRPPEQIYKLTKRILTR